MELIIANNQANNLLTLDLSDYANVQAGQGMDPADPQFTNKVWARSILREGATLAMEQLTEKELLFPLLLNAGSYGALALLVQQINQIVRTPGSTLTWQPDGAGQPTVFDGLSGQFDIDYDFRREQRFWTAGKLRYFAQPLGRAASPRPYAAASSVGPLLMISPYASSAVQTIAASTQAGVAGWGGRPMGASSGIFYAGSPSLAGDAPALLQISYVGPLPNQATCTGVVPYTAVSLLPDALYQPLVTARQITSQRSALRTSQTSIASSYLSLSATGSTTALDVYSFSPLAGPSDIALEPTSRWAGDHRLFAIARASQTGQINGAISAVMQLQSGPLNSTGPRVQTVMNGNSGANIGLQSLDWQLFDLGTFRLQPSQFPETPVQLAAGLWPAYGSCALDIAGLVMLPDATTWYLNPGQIYASGYGYPPAAASVWGAAAAPWSNTLILDDTVSSQLMFAGQSQPAAPSPLGAIPSSAAITSYTRGLLATPDPRDGLPIVAILGVGQTTDPPFSYLELGWTTSQLFNGASQPNPLNLQTMAQVNVLERTRYVFG